jgi:hypothetical protein
MVGNLAGEVRHVHMRWVMMSFQMHDCQRLCTSFPTTTPSPRIRGRQLEQQHTTRLWILINNQKNVVSDGLEK